MKLPLQVLLLLPTIVLIQLQQCNASLRSIPTSCEHSENYFVSSGGLNNDDCVKRESKSKPPCQTLAFLLPRIKTSSCVNVSISSTQNFSDGLIKLQQKNFWTITGNVSYPVTIHCSNNSGIFFSNFSDVHFENLQFVNCSATNTNTDMPPYHILEYFALYFRAGTNVEIINCAFYNASGTGIIMVNTRGTNLVRDSNFTSNRVLEGLKGSGSLKNRTAGGIIVRSDSDDGGGRSYTIESCNFVENENYECHYAGDDMIGLGGGLTFNLSTNANITVKDCIFANNYACEGGGIHIYHRRGKLPPNIFHLKNLHVSVIGSNFTLNHAIHEGGGVFMQQRPALLTYFTIRVKNSHFWNNSAEYGGGLGVYNGNNLGLNISSVTIEDSTWVSNRAVKSGFGFGLSSLAVSTARPTSKTIFNLKASVSDSVFESNTYKSRWSSVGAVHLQGVKAEFTDVKFLENIGTAVYIRLYSYIMFSGEVLFSCNQGNKGGALHIELNSITSLGENDTNVTFESNHAIVDGGAIYLEYTSDDVKECLFGSLKAQLNSSESFSGVSVLFRNNTAGALRVGGVNQSVFIDNAGGCLKKQNVTNLNVSMDDILLFDSRIFMYIPLTKTQVASFADNIEMHYNPMGSGNFIEVMPGEIFHLIPSAKDLFGNEAYQYGNLALTLEENREHAAYTNVELIGPNFISMDSFTPNNELYIKSDKDMMNRDNYKLYLRFYYAQHSSYQEATKQVQIKLMKCKVGFKFNDTEQVCKCNTVDSNLVCNSNHSYACVKYGYWHGNDTTQNQTIPCPGENCGYHSGKCPSNSSSCTNAPGYCLLNSRDSLCREGRSGLLCSNCKTDYAFTFAGVKCVPLSTCRPLNTAFFILGLIAYWVCLVVFVLFVLSVNLSVGSGIAYGIMYFFSVVKVFTTNTVTESFLQTVISTSVSVTQLYPQAFGEVSICFIGSWRLNLQHHLFYYVTPVAVIFLIFFVILSGRFCRCPKRISPAQNSPIHAICILVLASYTSLTYTSFEILRPVRIGGEWRVYADPEIKYFHLEQHLPYALVALAVELFISLPICFLILFAPCLSGRVNLVRLRLKPILDEFQACYRPECRWFAGFYFLARQLIFLVNIIPSNSLPEDNTYLHTLNAAIFIVYCAFQPYQLKWLNMLDTLLLADIIFLSFFRLEFSNIVHRIVAYVLILLPSLCLAFLILLVIIKRMSSCFRRTRKESPDNTRELPSNILTHTSVGINDPEDSGEREPLLAESRDSGHSTLSQNNSNEKDVSKTFTTSSVRISQTDP